MKKKNENIYDEKITYLNLLATWNIVRKTCKDKKAVYRFHFNKMTNIENIYGVLKKREYRPLKYSLFMITEPKPRLVMNQTVYDKIVNHFVSNFYLIPYLERKLIDSNVATRKNKGSRYASELLVKYINSIRLKEKDKEIYVLKMDIKKYFYNIDHNILIEMLKRDIQDKDVINIIQVMISETNKPYVNETIKTIKEKYKYDVPFYKQNVGLAIGSMHSQFLAIYYLNDLDHFIKEKLKCKYYIRYMDDIVLVSTDKNKLKEYRKIIEKELNKLHLEVNPKSSIYKLSEGIPFVGYRFLCRDRKFFVTYNKKTLKKVKKRLLGLHKHNMLMFYKSYASYYGYLKNIKKDVERNFIMKSIDKYHFYKKDNCKRIVFIKEGNFYKTYDNDAIVIWNLFNYKCLITVFLLV